MNQYELIDKYLEEHPVGITPMEAFINLGITKLSTRVGEMIRRGYKIEKTTVNVPTRYGKMARVTRYRRSRAQ